jgi:hypothetical protein
MPGSRKLKIAAELVSLIGLLSFQFAMLFDYSSLSAAESEAYLVKVVAFSLAVPLVVYAMARLVMPAIPTAIVVCGALYVVDLANRMKMAETGSPISFTDLTNTGNFSIVTAYLRTWELAALAIPLLALAVYYGWCLARRFQRRPLRAALHLLAVFLFSYGSTASGGQVSPAKLANSMLASSGVEYLNWGWKENVLKNGLFVHLMQTSVASLPRRSTAAERQLYAESRAQVRPSAGESRNVVMILCEACWNDERNFKPVFAPLLAAGMKEFRTVAPIFGGGTVNSDFEMITGLPANNRAVSGVIYQEYHRLISDRAHTLPARMRASGRVTAAMHNNTKTFWFRHEVMPKMGYDAFFGLEDMKPSPTGGWPDDIILYDKARAFLDAQPEKGRSFLMLSTVSTHGEFMPVNGDSGEADYTRRLDIALHKAADFINWLRRKDPTATILLFGDHKPALPKYLMDNKVLMANDFTKMGPAVKDFLVDVNGEWERIGDVPAYVIGPDAAAVDAFIAEADRKPMFCVSELFNRHFAGGDLPTYRHTAEACEHYRSRGYAQTAAAFPEWLYSVALFER